MKETITYIFRKPDPKFFSIESVFYNISKRIGEHSKVNIMKLNYSGGSLNTLWSNLKTFKKDHNTIYHITGDVHYMALVTGKKSVLTIHDVKSALQGSLLKRFYRRLIWFWLPALFVKRITVISQFTKIELQRIIPFAKNKIRIIYNPVDSKFQETSYKFNTEQPRILFIGTKVNKNLERSFKALKGLSCKVIVIGKLTELQINLLQELKIEYENHFNLTFEKIVESYKNCDLVCFASFYEGFGMPIIEAQATGRPVITSDFGAMREVSDNTTCLVNPQDMNAIRDAVLKICNNEDYRNQLIQNGFVNVKRFQPDYIANQYMEIYNEISS